MIAELIDKTGEARLTDLARGLSVTHVTANRTIKRLQRKGLVTSQPYRSIFLTTDGRSLAKESRDRHETVVRFLMALGVPAASPNPTPKGSSITSAGRRWRRLSGICETGDSIASASRGTRADRQVSRQKRQSEQQEQRCRRRCGSAAQAPAQAASRRRSCRCTTPIVAMVIVGHRFASAAVSVAR